MATFLGVSGGSSSAVTGRVYRLPIAYGSATTVTVGSGACRDSTDAADVALTSEQTVDVTATGSLGLNTLTSARTFTSTNGQAAATASGDVWSGDLDTNRRTLTGTFASTSQTLTGTGSKLLLEVAVGDVVRVGAKGGARVTSIASDTSAELDDVLPDGDADAGSTAYVYERPVILIGANPVSLISTINNAGTAVVPYSTPTQTASGQAGTWGGEIASAATQPSWYAVFAATISSNGRAFISTQRTTPYTLSGLTAFRLVGWVFNDSSGNLLPGTWSGHGLDREFRNESVESYLISNGADASWTRKDASTWAPPGARVLLASVGAGAAKWAYFRAGSLGAATATRNLRVFGSTGAGVVSTTEIPLDAAQCFDYVSEAGGAVYVAACGYRLSL